MTRDQYEDKSSDPFEDMSRDASEGRSEYPSANQSVFKSRFIYLLSELGDQYLNNFYRNTAFILPEE